MKFQSNLFIIAMLLAACENTETMHTTVFKAEKLSKTATITVNENIETVFPLFGAFEERKWANGWNPTLIYPGTETIEEGTTFKTHGHGTDEKEFLWRVSKFEPEKYLIQYLVSTQNRYWTITVKCHPEGSGQTSATITYTYIGLNDLGNKLNAAALQHMYKNNLKDWEEELNHYLANAGLSHRVN